MRSAILKILSIFVALFAVSSCNSSATDEIVGDTLTVKSQLLTIVDSEGYTLVDVKNPWKEGTLLQRYALVHRDSEKPKKLPSNAVVIEVPITSALVYSSVHAGAFVELGGGNAISGVADAEFFKIPEIVAKVESGEIVNVGNSMSPSIEKVVDLSPQIILASPFQNAGYGAIAKLGIPIMECADYMESTPLGRAEWIKLIGELLCKRDEATEIYNRVANEYNSLVEKVKDVDSKPVVISEMVTDGVWFIPGGKSYMAQMYADAGASYPWKDNASTGSLQYDFATVYDKAYNADYWIIKSYEPNFSLSTLESKYPLNKKMEAFSNGGVYVINTMETSFFEDFPFHPEKLLKEYIMLFHPDVLGGEQAFKYLRQVK